MNIISLKSSNMSPLLFFLIALHLKKIKKVMVLVDLDDYTCHMNSKEVLGILKNKN